MDQTLVRSGFDAEIALGTRYLQYLLLLALDAGVIPVEFTFADPDPTKAPITGRVVVPNDLDRTYPADPDAVQPEAGGSNALAIEVLFDDPDGADLLIQTRVRLLRDPDLDVEATIKLFVRLRLDKTRSGEAIETAALGIELVRVQGPGIELARLKPVVDRTLSLDGLGSSGRIGDIAMRKFAATGTAPAALVLYLNMVLRSGPQEGAFLEPRGDVLLGQNILPADADLAFATRADIYGHLAADAMFRRAVPSGSGYSFPLKFKHRNGTLLGVIVEPVDEGGHERLRMRLKAEVEVNNWPDPDITLVVDVFGGTDAEGVMTWNSASTAHESGLLYDILLAGVAAAFIPLVGPGGALLIFTGLEIGKHVAEEMIADYYIGERVEKRLDKTLLDIAPNRLTLLRRRWDPFYETQHQIGLRAGGTAINDKGMAFWGRAVLTRSRTVVGNVVIRDSERVGEEAPTGLRYRVADAEPFLPQLRASAPGADRLAFTHLDTDAEPNLFQVPTADAPARIAENRLFGSHPYLVKRVDMRGGTVEHLLLISQREQDEVRGALLDEHAAAVRPGIVAANEEAIRAAVIAEFAAIGLFPTAEQIEAQVAARLQALVDAEIEVFAAGPLAAELEARLLPMLRFELPVTHLGRLQQQGVLRVLDFDLVHVAARDAFYYRDRYIPSIETTAARRKADNLRSKPRYDSTPAGPVFLD